MYQKTIQLFVVIFLCLNLGVSFAKGKHDHKNKHHDKKSHHHKHHKKDKKDKKKSCKKSEFKSWDSLKNSSIVDFSEDDSSIVIETDCKVKLHKDFNFLTEKDLSIFAKELEIKKDSTLTAGRLLIVVEKEFELKKDSSLCASVVIIEAKKEKIKGDICSQAILLGSAFDKPSAQAVLEVSLDSERAPVSATFDWSNSFGLFESASIDFGDGSSQVVSEQSVVKVYEIAGNYTAQLALQTASGEVLSSAVEITVEQSNPIVDFGVWHIIRRGGTPPEAWLAPNIYPLVDAPEQIKEYRWVFGDGSGLVIPAAESPDGFVVHTFPEMGVYDVEVEAVTVSGASKKASLTIDLNNSSVPVPKYSVSSFKGEAPFTVTFTGEAYDEAGETITYNWFFSDTDEQFFGEQFQEVTHTFNNTGVNYVYLETRDELRGRRITYIPIYVGDVAGSNGVAPVAIVESTARFGEGPLTVDFSGIRSFDPSGNAGGLSYYWNFGDFRNPATNDAFTANAQHTFNQPGSYFVNLVVTNSEGLQHSEFTLVTVDGPEVNDIDFEVTLTGNLYEYNFSAFGYFEETDYLQVSPRWSFGDGTYLVNQPNVNHQYQSAGMYDIELKLRRPDGDYDSYTRRLNVAENQQASYAQIEKQSEWFNLGQSVQMRANFTQGVATDKTIYRWSLGDGTIIKGQGNAFNSIVHTYNEAGSKNIKLTITSDNGLTSVSYNSIQHNQFAPELDSLGLRNTQAPAPAIIAFAPYETVRDLDGNFSYFIYEFGDGSPNIQTIDGYQEHTYTTAGTYTLAVTVVDSAGLSNRYEEQLIIKENQAPILSDFNIYYFDQPAPASIGFEAWPYFSDVDGFDAQIYEFVWGDGSSEIANSGYREHTYQVGGDYQVSIRAQDNLGKWSEYVTKTLSVRTNLAPIIAYVPVYGQPNQPAPTSVAFAPVEGVTDDQGIARYTYDFADGSPLLDTTDGYVEHVFESAGTFNIVITAYDFYGLSDSFTVPLTIKANQPPVIADIIIGGADQIKPEKLTFDVRSVATDSDGFIVNYEFSLNGFSTTQGQDGGYWEVPFFGAGEFQIQATVTDNYGASASRSKSFFVDDNYAPVAVIDFDKDVIAVGESIELRASNSSDQDGTIVKYSWTLPDIGIVESETTVFSSATAGSYVIKLEVEDDKGKKATTQRSIRVNSPPEIIAECFLDELTGNTILCSAEGSNDEDGIANYKWSLDSNVFAGSQVSIPLTRYGNLIIGIELTDNFGAVDNLYLAVYVEDPNALPLASFDYQMEMGLVANFDAESSLSEGRKISKVLWEFEDGASIESSELKLSKNFQSVGEQNIKLTVFDDLNRTNTIEKTIFIYAVSVPDPGEAGRLTVEGVDSDNDGLRDDVQREIASIASGDIQREVTLKKAASSYQNIATGPIDRAQSVVFMRDSLDHFDCYLYQTDFSDQAIKDFGRLKAKVYNTKERFFNSLKSMDDFSGEVVNVSLDRQEYAQKCSN